MRKDTHKRTEPKASYRVRNWAQYNKGRISRGDITVWVEEALFTQADDVDTRGRGRPRVYADSAIQMLLAVKQVFRLPLRALQGFAQSLRKLAFANLPVPNYTTLCRRAQGLEVTLPTFRADKPLHIVLDSTGMKVYGEGEWKVRKHGYSKRRTWRKVHLAMDTNTGQICAALMTHQDVGDAEVLPELFDKIAPQTSLGVVSGDGAYDAQACYGAILAQGAQPVIPPREGAVHWPPGTPGATQRNTALDAIERSSRREWKKASGYHRRSLAETLMYRFKALTGPCLSARKIVSQATEVSIRAGVLNRMAALARPQSVRTR
jgi:hypothetical protein